MKEKQMQHKLEENESNNDSVLIETGQVGLVMEFEKSKPSRRMRLILRELLKVMRKVSCNFVLFLYFCFLS